MASWMDSTSAENTLNWSYRNWSILYRAHSSINDMCPLALITLRRHDISCRFHFVSFDCSMVRDGGEEWWEEGFFLFWVVKALREWIETAWEPLVKFFLGRSDIDGFFLQTTDILRCSNESQRNKRSGPFYVTSYVRFREFTCRFNLMSNQKKCDDEEFKLWIKKCF